MDLDELLAPQLRLEEARREPVDHREGEEAVPGERPRVRVRDRPVGVVREGVHRLHGEHRPLEGGHAVAGDRHDHELEDRVLDHLVPRAAQGEQAVDHAPPARRPEHDREDHAERGRPFGKGRVEQVVRAGPDVHEDQRPEVDDGQPVRVDGPVRHLRHEVVHHAEEGGGQEERDGVVAVPPLHEGILHAGVDRVALERAGGDGEVVEDVQDRDGDDRRDVEPERHVQVPLAPPDHRADEVHGEDDPHDGDHDVDRPLELGVFLGLGEAEGERDGGGDDDQLPAPEVHPAHERRRTSAP